MLLIKDDVAAAQLYHSLCSPRWYRWPLICLSEIGLFSLPCPGVAPHSLGSPGVSREGSGLSGTWCCLGGENGFNCFSSPILCLMVIPVKMGECRGFAGIEQAGMDQEQPARSSGRCPSPAVGLQQGDL